MPRRPQRRGQVLGTPPAQVATGGGLGGAPQAPQVATGGGFGGAPQAPQVASSPGLQAPTAPTSVTQSPGLQAPPVGASSPSVSTGGGLLAPNSQTTTAPPVASAPAGAPIFSQQNPFRGFGSAQEELAALRTQHQRNLQNEERMRAQGTLPTEAFSEGGARRFLRNSSLAGQNFQNRSDFTAARLAQLENFLGGGGAASPAQGGGAGLATGGPLSVAPGFPLPGPGDLPPPNPGQTDPGGNPAPGGGGGGNPVPPPGSPGGSFSDQIRGGIEALLGSGGGPTTQFGGDVQNLAQQTIQGGNVNPLTGQAAGAATDLLGGELGSAGQTAESAINQLLSRGGQLDPSVIGQRLETAQEGLNTLEQQRIAGLEARLANRGLGPESGALRSGIGDITRDIASAGAGAFRNILADEQAAANQRFNTGLSGALGLSGQQANLLGTGLGALTGLAGQQTGLQGTGLGVGGSLAGQQPGNLLGAANAGTNRQNVTTQNALQQFGMNQQNALNLANFALQRQQGLMGAQQQRFLPLLQLLGLLGQGAGQSRGGFI